MNNLASVDQLESELAQVRDLIDDVSAGVTDSLTVLHKRVEYYGDLKIRYHRMLFTGWQLRGAEWTLRVPNIEVRQTRVRALDQYVALQIKDTRLTLDSQEGRRRSPTATTLEDIGFGDHELGIVSFKAYPTTTFVIETIHSGKEGGPRVVGPESEIVEIKQNHTIAELFDGTARPPVAPDLSRFRSAVKSRVDFTTPGRLNLDTVNERAKRVLKTISQTPDLLLLMFASTTGDYAYIWPDGQIIVASENPLAVS